MEDVQRKVFLLSIDGWGLAPPSKGNAVANAETPTMDKFCKPSDTFAELDASSLHVGLPEGVMGNSEVGHLTMGAGRAKFQDLVRINASIEDGSFAKNPRLLDAFEYAGKNGGRVHFLGLVSDGGVHSHIKHLFKFLELAKSDSRVTEAFVHFFSDGRDTKPVSGTGFVKQLLDKLDSLQFGKLATLVGRYYAMDRDKRWERIQIAYDLLTKGVGKEVDRNSLIESMEENYKNNIFDEQMTAHVLDKNGLIRSNDTMIFIDFRSDRMREICETFGVKPPFETDTVLENLHVVQMTQFSSSFQLPILFAPQTMDNVLAEWLAKKNIRQFHTAETEKYAHVTFFFNGGKEEAFPLEDRKLVSSPKVATYDLKPEMAMHQVGDEVATAIKSGNYPFVMCNFAPPDMVGHTGNYEMTVKACEETDIVIGKLAQVCQEHKFTFVITSDHGNAEEMLDENDKPKTSHNSNLVPFIVLTPQGDSVALSRKRGTLADVAPTILKLMGLDIPSEMTGSSLL